MFWDYCWNDKIIVELFLETKLSADFSWSDLIFFLKKDYRLEKFGRKMTVITRIKEESQSWGREAEEEENSRKPKDSKTSKKFIKWDPSSSFSSKTLENQEILEPERNWPTSQTPQSSPCLFCFKGSCWVMRRSLSIPCRTQRPLTG